MNGNQATIVKLPPQKEEIRRTPEKEGSKNKHEEEEEWMNGNNPLLEPIPVSLTLEKAKGGVEVLKSKDWKSDDVSQVCSECSAEFHALNRRHHCRLCGNIFCHNCSSKRALVPPSSIVLEPKGGKKVLSDQRSYNTGEVSFEGNADPDRTLTYMQAEYGESSEKKRLLYGKGLEERTKLAREPLRVCNTCHQQLQSVQNELRNCNSNAMRYNAIDPTDIRRLFNSPLAFTLGHEIRKAAYTLNNLLPLPRRLGTFEPMSTASSYAMTLAGSPATEHCKNVFGNMNVLDGVRIPARLLEKAKGVAVMTVVKGGFGIAGFEFGTGLVVARLSDQSWSPPCAIGTAGFAFGALVGAQISDHVFLCMTDQAVDMLSNNAGSFQLGADIAVAVGPVGRAVEADISPANLSPIYTYSFSKGLYAGLSLDGKVIVTRHVVNERFYGHAVSPHALLSGQVPTPPAAQPLYDALKRCHQYASTTSNALSSISPGGQEPYHLSYSSTYNTQNL